MNGGIHHQIISLTSFSLHLTKSPVAPRFILHNKLGRDSPKQGLPAMLNKTGLLHNDMMCFVVRKQVSDEEVIVEKCESPKKGRKTRARLAHKKMVVRACTSLQPPTPFAIKPTVLVCGSIIIVGIHTRNIQRAFHQPTIAAPFFDITCSLSERE